MSDEENSAPAPPVAPAVKKATPKPPIKAPAEDNSYLAFVVAAFAVALAGGFLIAVLLPLIESGTIPGAERGPRLIQAHGWAQLQGWTGLFVAGMALRLLPRFAGRKALQGTQNFTVLAFLLTGVIIRTIVEPFGSGAWGDTLMMISAILSAIGTAAVAVVVTNALMRGRRKPDAWRYFALAGAACWLLWAVLLVVAASQAIQHDRYTPARFDDTLTWIVMLGAVGNFIWTVQSRSVPVFFGRKNPTLRRALAPGILVNLGVALLAISLIPMDEALQYRIEGLGLAISGAAILWLAPLAGAIRGQAHRLRPRARAASRFVLAANLAALVAGLFLLWAGTDSLLRGEFAAFALRDGARHAFGVGLISMLVLGMVQLVAPVFALSRAEERPAPLWERSVFWFLVAAAILRVVASVLMGHMDEASRLHLVSTSGALAWIGLAMFATMVVRAVLRQTAMKAILGVPTT